MGRMQPVAGASTPAGASRLRRVLRGGTVGNRRLTAMLAAVLLVLLAVEGVTILFLGQLRPVHVFVGFVLIPVVTFKVGSTFYRFVRYYTGVSDYVDAGPPVALLRVIGPLVVLSSVALLGTGVALILVGPHNGGVYTLHKGSFIVWLPLMTAHVLGHLRRVQPLASADFQRRDVPGGDQRWRGVLLAVGLGLVLALATFPLDTSWHHHHGFH